MAQLFFATIPAISEDEQAIVLGLTSARKLPGFGGKHAQTLRELGVETVLDLRRFEKKELCRIFGESAGGEMHRICWRASEDEPVFTQV